MRRPEGEKVCFTVATDETCMLEVKDKEEPYVFSFDRFFDQDSKHADIFKQAGVPTVDNLIAGSNSTVLSYGHWGHGKMSMTLGHTDSPDTWGIAPRIFQYLFDRIADEESSLSPPPHYTVTCSSFEIYNETINDLLTLDSKNLPLKKDRKKAKGAYVEGLTSVQIESGEHLFAAL